jgi:DNA-binding transcriptional LysR family regulator
VFSTADPHGVPRLLNRLRMRQVALLLAIEEAGTLRAAAGRLGMTQPAATKMLHELEGTLGQPLFERVGRGLRLAAAGALVLAHFHGLRGTMQALARELEELRLGSGGKLCVGSIMAASPTLLAGAVLQLKARVPLLAVEIVVDSSDRLIERLREGTLDVVIGRVPDLAQRDFHFRPIADEALAVVAACGHPLAGRRRVSFAALLDHPWIVQSIGSPLRDVIEQEFRSHHAPLPKGLIETSSVMTTVHLVAGTTMVAVIPHSIAAVYRRHGLLEVLRYTLGHGLPSYGSIVRRDRPPSRAAGAFLELLHAQADPPQGDA